MTARRRGASSSGTRRSSASGAGRRPSTPSRTKPANRRTSGETGASRPDPQRAARAAASGRSATAAQSDAPVWGFTKRTLILTVIVVIAVASVLPFLNAWIRQQQELSRLRDQVVQQEQTVEGLEVAVARWEDPAFVMAQARERLLYALPGETQYRLTDTSGAEVPQSPDAFVSESEVSEDWFDALWTSVQAADEAGPDSAVSEPVEEEPDAPPATSPATEAPGSEAPATEAPEPADAETDEGRPE